MKEYLKKHRCKRCKKNISYTSWKYGTGYCRSCGKKGKRNPNFKNPKKLFGDKTSQWKGIITKCSDCEKILKDRRSKHCRKCSGIQHSLYLKQLFKNKENHFRYIHGKGNAPYPIEFNKKLKYQIRQRDNFICQNCETNEINHFRGNKHIKLIIHHIDYDVNNCNKENLITLCNNCNVMANSNRDYWYAYYKYIMENINE